MEWYTVYVRVIHTRQSARRTLPKWPSDYHYVQMKVYSSTVRYGMTRGGEDGPHCQQNVLCVRIGATQSSLSNFVRNSQWFFVRAIGLMSTKMLSPLIIVCMIVTQSSCTNHHFVGFFLELKSKIKNHVRFCFGFDSKLGCVHYIRIRAGWTRPKNCEKRIIECDELRAFENLFSMPVRMVAEWDHWWFQIQEIECRFSTSIVFISFAKSIILF